MNMTFADSVSGYRHAEVCTMSADGNKRDGNTQVCNGTAVVPDGSKHDFIYVFTRK